ncbi:MAG: hypothetical protein ACRC2J_07005, partial [Microcoleaceae cyanobacterium]
TLAEVDRQINHDCNYHHNNHQYEFATDLNINTAIESSTYNQLDKLNNQSDDKLADQHKSIIPIQYSNKNLFLLGLILTLLSIIFIPIYYFFYPSKPTKPIDPLRNPNFSPRFMSENKLMKIEDIDKICQSGGKLPLYYTRKMPGPFGSITFQGRMDFSINPQKACNYDYRGTFVDRGSDGQICTGYVRLFTIETDEAGISKIYASWKITGDRSCESLGRNPTLVLYRYDLFR